ncbi:MAG: hypothetical protein ACRDNW_09735 [Trebonia sp.]
MASKPTDAVTYGFLPAAARVCLDVTVVTDQPAAHRAALAAAADSGAGSASVAGCDVWDFRALIRGVGAGRLTVTVGGWCSAARSAGCPAFRTRRVRLVDGSGAPRGVRNHIRSRARRAAC